MSERAEESAAAHGVAPGQQVGLGLPRWTGWAGSACFIAAIVLTVFTIIRTVRLVAGWEALDHPHAGLVGVIIRWAVVTVLFLLGWLLTTANSRARAKAAAATLRDLT